MIIGAQPMAGEQFTLVRSIIHHCFALRMPQTFLQRLGMTAQIVPLKGLTLLQAQAIVDRLNAVDEAWVAQVVSSGPEANLPLLQWRSADVSLSTPIGAKLYLAAGACVEPTSP